ncbi:MAG: nucleoside-diphosphate kinase [Candidatus Margulisiibacteriota bacterium]|nr:nucleoside-diphosphate kinase [Candidatus Margulisiibacteriota bacterium]
MIKPDGVSRGLSDEIIKRVEESGLKVARKYQQQMQKDTAAELYSIHQGKPFYNGLMKFITSGPVICTIVEGEDAIVKLREIMGATDPRAAAAGTIRGDLKEADIFTADKTIKNLVHGSDSSESAGREMAIFFKEGIK